MNYVILQILFVGVIGERANAVYDYFGTKEITAVLFCLRFSYGKQLAG